MAALKTRNSQPSSNRPSFKTNLICRLNVDSARMQETQHGKVATLGSNERGCVPFLRWAPQRRGEWEFAHSPRYHTACSTII